MHSTKGCPQRDCHLFQWQHLALERPACLSITEGRPQWHFPKAAKFRLRKRDDCSRLLDLELGNLVRDRSAVLDVTAIRILIRKGLIRPQADLCSHMKDTRQAIPAPCFGIGVMNATGRRKGRIHQSFREWTSGRKVQQPLQMVEIDFKLLVPGVVPKNESAIDDTKEYRGSHGHPCRVGFARVRAIPRHAFMHAGEWRYPCRGVVGAVYTLW